MAHPLVRGVPGPGAWAAMARSRRPVRGPLRTGPQRFPPAPGPCGPGRCWSWRPRPQLRCGPGWSVSRRRPDSGGSPRCRESGPSPRGLDHPVYPAVREVVGDLLVRARDGRAGGLSPASAGRGGTGAVAHHHPRVLPAGPGPGHGDRAGSHAARRRRCGPARRWNQRADRKPVPRLVPRGPRRTARGPDHRPKDAGRIRFSTRGQSRPTAGPKRHLRKQGTESSGDRSGPPDRREAGRSREAGITAGLAQRRSQRFQRGPERPGAHDQRRAGRHSIPARPWRRLGVTPRLRCSITAPVRSWAAALHRTVLLIPNRTTPDRFAPALSGTDIWPSTCRQRTVGQPDQCNTPHIERQEEPDAMRRTTHPCRIGAVGSHADWLAGRAYCPPFCMTRVMT